jgi:cation:H+ antiporter
VTILLLILGFVFLIAGAEVLVRGAVWIANLMRISPLIIGLTVVAFGTSAPELVISIFASINGEPDISLGNVIGSNIFNVLFILGISALIVPLLVSRQLIKLDVPIMILCSFGLLILTIDGILSFLDGVILLAGLFLYLITLIYQARKDKQYSFDEFTTEYGTKNRKTSASHKLKHLGFILIGLVLLIIGSRWVVNGAQFIAQYLGISDLIIGLTVVAAGTSLPEIATSIVASLRGERDIAVGNVVGSNIFNILGVLGCAIIFAPNGMTVSTSLLRFDIPIMITVAVACLPIFFTGNLISRWEGGVFLTYYIAYLTYIVLEATNNVYLLTYTHTMLFFVVPLTALTIIIIFARSMYKTYAK